MQKIINRKECVVVLGSTGSIGTNTLNVIRRHLDKYQIFALTANTNYEKLCEQCLEFKPQYAVLLDKTKAFALAQDLKSQHINTEVLAERDDLAKITTLVEVDTVMSAIVGSSGLLPTYNALKAGKKVLLANKESLITSGRLMLDALRENQSARLIPVDSEHSAILQSLSTTTEFVVGRENNSEQISKIILTASGGPFRGFDRETLTKVTADAAVKHPNWVMGAKISVDSSTLMNKGLEVIEAYWLFALPLKQIEVVIHPQSIIHSMVEYIDGSIIAQLGSADMQTPIAYALSYPRRIESGSSKLDLLTMGTLSFATPDYANFPCLELAINALKSGKAAPAVLNAANEIAVAKFLKHEIGFYDINRIVEASLAKFAHCDYHSIAEVMVIDQEVRNYALLRTPTQRCDKAL